MVPWIRPLVTTTTTTSLLLTSSYRRNHHRSAPTRLVVGRNINCLLQLSMSSSSSTPPSSDKPSDTSPTTSTSKSFSKPIVQYIFVRNDLNQDWPQGAIAAQVAHASVAAIIQGLNNQDEATIYYTSSTQLNYMTKNVYKVNNVEELNTIKEQWDTKFGSNSYYMWIEQPENIPTALATVPLERTNPVSKLIKKFNVEYL